MYDKNVEEIQETCWLAVTDLCKLQAEINEEIGEQTDNEREAKELQIYDNFATRVAKASAKKILETGFYVDEDHDTLKILWIDMTAEVSNKILESVSFLGYRFEIKKEYTEDRICLDFVSQDERCFGYGEIENAKACVMEFIAEDLLRIATGRVLKRKKIYTAEEKEELHEERITEDIISAFADCIGNELSYKEVHTALTVGEASSHIIRICNEITEEVTDYYRRNNR